jgi:hypothetical protein
LRDTEVRLRDPEARLRDTEVWLRDTEVRLRNTKVQLWPTVCGIFGLLPQARDAQTPLPGFFPKHCKFPASGTEAAISVSGSEVNS